jgi:uncharacterized phiE125 gp8 family phage protein
MKVLRLSEPSVEPVSLQEAKEHLRVRHDEEDALITRLISAARARVEDYCNRPFVSAQFAILYDGELPRGNTALRVPLAGIVAIDAISYIDVGGEQAAFSTFSFDGERQTIRPATVWPAGTDLRVEVEAGGNADDVPFPIKAAINLYLGGMYELRESQVVGTILAENPAAVSLIDPYRDRMGI